MNQATILLYDSASEPSSTMNVYDHCSRMMIPPFGAYGCDSCDTYGRDSSWTTSVCDSCLSLTLTNRSQSPHPPIPMTIPSFGTYEYDHYSYEYERDSSWTTNISVLSSSRSYQAQTQAKFRRLHLCNRRYRHHHVSCLLMH